MREPRPEFKRLLDAYGISAQKAQFIKIQEISIQFMIAAFDPNSISLKDHLKEQWLNIFGKKLADQDIPFVDEFDFIECGYEFYDFIKRNGIAKSKKKGATFRQAWVFLYLAKFGNELTAESFSSLVGALSAREQRFHPRSSTVFTDFSSILDRTIVTRRSKDGSIEEWFKDLGERIEKKYANDLEYIIDDIIEAASTTETGAFWRDTYRLEAPAALLKLAATDYVRPVKKKKGDDGEAEKEPTTSGSSPVIVPAKENEPNQGTVNVAPQDVIVLIKHKEKALEIGVPQVFEESLNRLIDLSQQLADAHKLEGIESLIRTLNSEAYGCLLDRVYFAIQSKNDDDPSFKSVAVLLSNALKEFGFSFETYPKEPIGFCIGAASDDDAEYISRNYRWRGEKILYKNLFVAAPGITNRATKQFVYPPLLEVKENGQD